MNWFMKHWQLIAWLTALLGGSLVFAKDEYKEYVSMQEAVKSQKEFNENFDTQVRDMEIRQERMDMNIIFMKEMLDKIDKKLDK